MKIFIASDHAGFSLKKFLIESLTKDGHELIDCGAYEMHPNDDYPDFISKVALDVSEVEEAIMIGAIPAEKAVRGIVIGGSGQGEAIVANRFPHVRAVVFYGGSKEVSHDIIKLSRQHNDANILSIGARFVTEHQAHEAVTLWLDTPFLHGKHERRIEEIEDYPDKGLFSL